jgi:hypothetical protein
VAGLERRDRLGPPLAAVVEFMTRARAEVVPRLGEYCLQIHRQLPAQRDPLVLFDVVGYLINLTGTLESGLWQMQPVGLGGLGMTVNVGVVNLEELSAWRLMREVISGTTARVVLVWLPLCAGGGDSDLVRQWVEQVSQEPEERRTDLAALVVLFADLAGCGPVWRAALEGWNMERSAWLQERDQRIEAQVRLQEKRVSVLRVFQARLRSELPADMVEVVQQQDHPDVLKRWFEQGVFVDSLEEARTILGLSAAGAPPT